LNAIYATINLDVYLAYSGFTDAGAMYYVNYSPFASYPLGTIDQKHAISGWTTLEVTDVYTLNAGGGFSSSFAYVVPSGNTSGTTGADAVSVTFKFGD